MKSKYDKIFDKVKKDKENKEKKFLESVTKAIRPLENMKSEFVKKFSIKLPLN
jgi:hypothetical protein